MNVLAIDDVIERGNIKLAAFLNMQEGQLAIPNQHVDYRALHHTGDEAWEDAECVHCIVKRHDNLYAVTITGELCLTPQSENESDWYEVHGRPMLSRR